MSAVELVTAALAAGAGAGLSDTTSTAVRDAYAELKGLLKRRIGGHDERAQLALDADETEAGGWQARIGDSLTASGASSDEQILASARHLLALAGPDRTTHNFNVRTSSGAVGEFHGPVTFNQGPPVPPAPPAVG